MHCSAKLVLVEVDYKQPGRLRLRLHRQGYREKVLMIAKEMLEVVAHVVQGLKMIDCFEGLV
jgi:hypothetical protein